MSTEPGSAGSRQRSPVVSESEDRWLEPPKPLTIAVWLILLALAFAIDQPAFRWVRSLVLYDRWSEMRELVLAAKVYASGLGTALIALTIAVADRRGWRRAAAFVVVVGLATGVASVIKMASGRERPSAQNQGWDLEVTRFHGPVTGIRESSAQSFPSGHTTTAFASATALGAFYPPARLPILVVATLTGANRMVKHQHFISDVLAGAALGYLLAAWGLRRRRIRALWEEAEESGVVALGGGNR